MLSLGHLHFPWDISLASSTQAAESNVSNFLITYNVNGYFCFKLHFQKSSCHLSVLRKLSRPWADAGTWNKRQLFFIIILYLIVSSHGFLLVHLEFRIHVFMVKKKHSPNICGRIMYFETIFRCPNRQDGTGIIKDRDIVKKHITCLLVLWK